MTAGNRTPLLRSPPFPRVKARIAAVSRPAPIATVTPPSAAILSLIAEARVGGTFWLPPTADARPIVLRPSTPAEADTMLAAALAAGARPRDIVGVINAVKPRPIAARLARAGVTLSAGAVDPWSLLAPGVCLHATARDEWTLIAALAGAELAGDPDMGDALARAIGHVAYRDCFTGADASSEEAIAILAAWRHALDRNRSIAVAMGMAWWKRDAIGQMLWTGRRTPLRFLDDTNAAVDAARGEGGAIAAWPSRAPAGLEIRATEAGVPVVQIEDGFVRSVGLGSNLHPPQSIVLDRRGIYYDPSRPSDLEDILQHTAFTPELLARGEAVARFIVARGISKYARGSEAPAPRPQDGRRLVLVTGQVEDDLSVKRAGGAVAGNLDLLRRTRAAEPDARILFKPHPDVDAGHRVGRIEDRDALAYVDEVVRTPIDGLLEQVDAVHVLTSLTGFEALLRGREVIVHGQPFYAGWGLTTDLGPPLARRTRRLSLAELVAGTLILYPLYLDPVTRLPCPPEMVLERFASGRQPKPSLLIRLRALQGLVARLLGKATTPMRGG